MKISELKTAARIAEALTAEGFKVLSVIETENGECGTVSVADDLEVVLNMLDDESVAVAFKRTHWYGFGQSRYMRELSEVCEALRHFKAK